MNVSISKADAAHSKPNLDAGAISTVMILATEPPDTVWQHQQVNAATRMVVLWQQSSLDA